VARALAAVPDDDLGLDECALMLATPVDRVAGAWRELEAAGLARGGRLRHGLVGEVLLASLPAAIREALYARHGRRRAPRPGRAAS